MEVKVNIIGKKRKVFFLVIGVVFLVYAVVEFFIIRSTPIGALFPILMGIYWLHLGLAKVHLLINSEFILQKGRDFSEKKKFVLWKDIKSINPKIDELGIIKTDGTIVRLFYDMFEYSSVREIKKTIFALAKEKNVPMVST